VRAKLAAALLVLPSLLSTAHASPAPYDLVVEVTFSDGAPSPTLASEVERRILDALVTRACFESVRGSSPGDPRPEADLLLHLDVFDIEDDTRYDDSLAGFVNPDSPNAQMGYTLLLSIQVVERLLALPAETEIDRQRFRPQVTRRPMRSGEDVRRAAREEMLTLVARRAAAFACGASKKKVRQAVEAARSQEAPAR
jgi:hypothetical protein